MRRIAILLVSMLPLGGAPAVAADVPPNIVLIMADDISADELACYGHATHRTPNLDRLARDGVQFATCYSTPICHPTRFEIMTGQYGHHNGVYQFPGRRGGPVVGSVEDDIASHVTFAQVLKPRGYATCLAGKWQLTGKIPDLIVETGFDEYCMWAYTHNLPEGVVHDGGWEGAKGGKTCRYWHPSIVENGKYLDTEADDYGPDIFTDFLIDFVRRNKNKPFFLYYPMALTHAPYYPTPDMNPAEAEKFRHSKDHWQAQVEYMDKLVGRLVEGLKQQGVWDNTVLLFTGDNGTGGHGKGQVTERGALVPMIAVGAGVVKQVEPSKELVDLSDVLPTLADLAGAALPDPAKHPIDGHSFAPLLRGEAFTPREWIYAYLGDGRIVRTKRWLLEKNFPNDNQFGRLYDCGTCRDGSAYRDVTDSQEPEVLAARKMMLEILADKPVPNVAADARFDNKPRPGAKKRRKNK